MSWFVLQWKQGREEELLRSCRQHLSKEILEEAFVFQSERLWRGAGGEWKKIIKDMFPGYVFLQSSRPEELTKELEEYRKFANVMEEPGYLISVYSDEEEYLRRICGSSHIMKLSYGYKENGINYIVEGPLKGLESQITKTDWHRRFARIKVPVAGRSAEVWAGLGLAREWKVS